MTDKYRKLRARVNAWVADAGNGYVSITGVFNATDLRDITEVMEKTQDETQRADDLPVVLPEAKDHER